MKLHNVIKTSSYVISSGPVIRAGSLCAVVAFSISFSTSILIAPARVNAQEVMFQMEESESPPKGVKQMAQEIQQAEEERLKSEQTSAPSSGPSRRPSDSGGSEGGEKSDYNGVFKAFYPVKKIFPLKSGNIKANFISLANNTGTPASYLSRRNMSGSYFLESAETDVGFIKNFSGKVQYNKQLRNALSVNSMNEWGATLLDVDLKLIRSVARTGSAGTQNVSDTRKFSASHEFAEGYVLSYDVDRNISRSVTATPTKADNKKQTWSFVAPLKFKEGAKFTLTHANTANRNISGNPTAKVLQTDLKLDLPINAKFDLNLGYQFLGTRSIPVAAASSKNRKSTRSIGLTYKFSEGSKISYLYNLSNNRNFSTISTNFLTVNRDTQFERAFSKDAKMKLGYVSTYDQAAGTTDLRTGAFSLDHKDFNILPGATTVEARKQYSQTSTSSKSDYTFSVATPLSYWKGRLTTRIQNVLSSQKDVNTFQRNRSLNQTFSTDFKITKQLTVGTSMNRVKSRNYSPVATSSRAIARVRTDKLTYDMGKVLKFVNPLQNVKYSYSLSRNGNHADIPAPALALTRVRNHSIIFAFKGDVWNGNYDLGRSFSISYGGQTQRAIKHKVTLNFTELWGCQLTTNYTGTFQKSGSQNSAILKLTKKITEKRSYFVSFESLSNKVRDAAAVNTQNRYLEAGVDLTF